MGGLRYNLKLGGRVASMKRYHLHKDMVGKERFTMTVTQGKMVQVEGGPHESTQAGMRPGWLHWGECRCGGGA